MSERLTLIVPGDPDQLTGGYRYDARIVDALRKVGWSVDVVGLAGRFPDADEEARQAMECTLSGLADGARVVIDGLALGGVPDVVASQARRLDLTGLVHHPLADETGLPDATRHRLLESERHALSRCQRVIVTSAFTAERLSELGLFDASALVVEPGVDAAEPAPRAVARAQGREPPPPARLLCVASLTPRKGQDVLVAALAGLADRAWTCVLAGSRERDPVFADRLEQQIEQAGLSERMRTIGECNDSKLATEYEQADVCLLPSHYEGYGMVVSEALARGLPLITTRGGALARTVPDDCGLKVEVGDVTALRHALADWLDEPLLRQSLSLAAMKRRESLRGWAAAGREFAEALSEGGHR